MKKKFTILITAALMLLTMMARPVTAWGQTTATESVTLSNGSFSTDHITWTCADGNITIQQIKGSGSSAVNSNYISAPRVYKGHVLSFVGSNNYTINSISITYSGNYTGNSMTAGTAMSGNTVTDNLTDVNRTWATTSGGTHVVSAVSSAGLEAIYIQNVASSTNTQLRPTGISITYTIPSSSNPTISANNVEIDYDATQGSISYTLDNASGNVTAAITSGDWITGLGTITENEVPFTCSANETAVARTATVTLSYSGANDKVVTITQGGNPNVFITIAEARDQGTGDVVTKGYVTSCVGTTGYIQDATAAICVYGSSLTVGDEIRVAGTLTNYNGLLEITSPTVTVVSSGNTIEPELMTIAEAVASTNQGWFIRIEDATVTNISGSGNSQNTTVKQGENTIVVRGNLSTTVAVNDHISFNGNIGYYNGNQIANPQDVTVLQNDDPTISAENVNIAYNATEGVIEYTVNNPVSGGSLTASTTADWLTIGTVGETVPFTCTANEAVTARTATVTLTYTYNTTETVTKDVTVTQAAYEAPHYTWDLSTDQTATATATEMTWTSNFATMAVEKYNASTATNNYYPGTPNQSYTSTRFYKNSKLTIAPVAGYAITGVVFTATTESYATAFEGSSWTNASAVANGTTITVTPTDGLNDIVAVIGGTCGFTAVSVYYVEDNTPSITANNVEIAYDATSGEIAYTLNNPAANGSLSVSENVEWISNATLSTTESKVTFDCQANLNSTSREGVVTITYTYGDSQTISKEVTVTQTAAPVVYSTIPDLFAAATSTATDVTITFNNWVVSGVSTNGKNVFVTDGTNGFVIYSSTDMSSIYSAGNILNGTITCSLKLQNGYAQLTDVDGLTINDGGAVTVAAIEMANLAGINTGALVHYENLTCSVDNNKYYLSDGTTTLQVYSSLYTFSALESGKSYNITGIYQQYGETKEVLPRSADDIEEVASTTPSVTVTPSIINAPFGGTNGTLAITYENIPGLYDFDYYFCDAEGNELLDTDPAYPGDWIDAEIQDNNGEYSVVYTIHANDGDARTAYFKVYFEAYYSIVTVNQEAYVAPSYAELPFSFNGGRADIEGTDGLTQEGLGTDYNATSNPTTKLKFDGTGDWLLLQFNERPGTLTFDIKGNSFSGGTFTVQTSEDGATYTDLETYTDLGDTQSESFNTLGENVRYIKWIYTEKSSGNVGLGNIALAAYAEPAASITVANGNANIDVNATGVDNATLAIAYENLTITDQGDFDIQYYNENGDELGKDDQPDWMEASIQVNTTQDGYEVSYSVDPNDGAARTAYFKVYALDNNSELVYSNLVTINQAAYVAPVATITIADGNANINVDVTGVENATLAIAYENLTITENTDFDIQYYNENGDELGKDDEPIWMAASIQENSTQDGYEVSYDVFENTGAARTAYFKVYALDNNSELVYSNLVTINQSAYVVDYATLPFEWAGGPRSDFEALNGTSTYSVGDYGDNQGVYRMKLDGSGDYIQIKTNEQPGIVTIGVKMVGGATTSTLTVQGSADGLTFTDIEDLTISGSQNTELTLATTNDFDAADRYVRLLFTKGSNVGVGPITIAKHVVKYAVNLNQPLNNEGSISADKETAAEGETVTLTATPNTGYAFGSWTVLDGDAQEVTVTNNAFVMPASDVEVEATFTALDKHIIVIPVAIENNVIVDVTNNQAYANETVTITVDAPDNKVLATLTVTGNTSSNNITIAPEVSPYVDEYTFTMPDEDVTINATFDDAPSFTVSFSVNGSVDASLEVSVSQGQSTALPTSSTLTPEGFSITGWAATNASTEAVADPYTPNADITLYAILGQAIPHSLVITASTPNFPTSYGTANTFTEYNLGGKNFKIQQGFINGGKLQWRAAGNNNGTGTMYNSEDLGKINTIILVYDESDTKKNFTIKAGTTENPTEGTSIEPSTNGLVYTFDLSQGNYKYFVMTNGENAGYLQSIAIDYVADLNVNTIAHIATSTTYTTDIPATTCVIVDSGAVLTLNGTNNGTPDNLIIEDGGQLIHNDPVSATMRMTVSGYGRGGSGYKFIASPVSGSINVGSTNLTDGSYDLYIFDQSKAGEEWRNYKASAFTTIDNGKGYLYAHNPTTTIEFAGELQPSNVNVDVNLDYTAEKPFSGVNLVGNPFACNAYVNTAYYVMNTTGDNYVAKTTADAIPPCTGILVGATAASQKVTFSKNAPSANPGQGNLNIQVAQVVNTRGVQPTSDNAIIRFDGGNTLEKFSFRDDRAKLYIPQGKRDYAVVNAEAQGETPLYFKAVENGTYTIDFSKENVEFSYLHLIDNLTGVDIDLLQNPSYSFEANNKDYPSRFRLMFKANSINANGSENENFGFISNGNLMILGIDGEATLQVIDITGRILSSETFSGSYNKAVNGVAGVYMIRLIQGENVRTQKIVVK